MFERKNYLIAIIIPSLSSKRMSASWRKVIIKEIYYTHIMTAVTSCGSIIVSINFDLGMGKLGR